MPNWVLNNMTVSGPSESLLKFRFDMSQPVPFADKKDGDTRVEGDPLVILYEPTKFSFWNIIAPPEDKWDLYFTMSGWREGKEYGNTEWNWYKWNIANWDCKWDVSDYEEHAESVDENGDSYYSMTFSTPWSPPLKVYAALGQKYNDLTFSISYREENDWGGEIRMVKGELVKFEEWDSPKSHTEHRERYGECDCAHQPWRPYKDCPAKEEEEILNG